MDALALHKGAVIHTDQNLTDHTLKTYATITHRILNRYLDDTGDTLDSNPLSEHRFTAWLSRIRSSWTRATWRLYRAALTHSLTSSHPDVAIRTSALDVSPCLRLSPKHPNAKTSTLKYKEIPEHKLSTLNSELLNSRSFLDRAAIALLNASILIGLRPEEWTMTQKITQSGRTGLRVTNAKATQGRSHGDHRTLWMDKFSPADIELIDKTVLWIARNSHRWNVLYGQLRKRLNLANRRLFPKDPQRITLYSARHQFVADAKRACVSPLELAALMGHRSIETAQRRYGKTGSGRRGAFRVSADPSDMAQIQTLQTQRTVPAELAALSSALHQFLQSDRMAPEA